MPVEFCRSVKPSLRDGDSEGQQTAFYARREYHQTHFIVPRASSVLHPVWIVAFMVDEFPDAKAGTTP